METNHQQYNDNIMNFLENCLYKLHIYIYIYKLKSCNFFQNSGEQSESMLQTIVNDQQTQSCITHVPDIKSSLIWLSPSCSGSIIKHDELSEHKMTDFTDLNKIIKHLCRFDLVKLTLNDTNKIQFMH